MNKYQAFLNILNEQADTNDSEDVKNNPKLKELKRKAEIIRTKAEYIRASNQMKNAKLDSSRIKLRSLELKQQKKKTTQTVFGGDSDQPLNSGDPINQPSEKEKIQKTSEQPEAQNDKNDKNDITEGPDDAPEEDEDLSQLPTDAEEQEDISQEPTAEIAGSKPQTKEEAEIARLQAQTREVQSKIGEYSPPGAMQPGMEGDPAMGGMEGDPAMGGMDPMTGMPTQEKKPDPLKGLGDTTVPQDPMAMYGGMGGMGGIDPMTGMPIDEDEAPKSTTTIGRLYLLKKIYCRLSILDNVLLNSADSELKEVTQIVSEAYEIYRVIIENLKCYKEKIDEVITDYYILIRDICNFVENHFKKKHIEQK